MIFLLPLPLARVGVGDTQLPATLAYELSVTREVKKTQLTMIG